MEGGRGGGGGVAAGAWRREGVAAGAWAPGSTSAPGKMQRLHAGTQLSLFSLRPQPRVWCHHPPSAPVKSSQARPSVCSSCDFKSQQGDKAQIRISKAFTQGGVLQSLGTGPLPVTFTQPLVLGVFTQPRCPSFTKWVGLVMCTSLL